MARANMSYCKAKHDLEFQILNVDRLRRGDAINVTTIPVDFLYG